MGFLITAIADTADLTCADLMGRYDIRLLESVRAGSNKIKTEEGRKNFCAARILLIKLLETEGVITENEMLPEIMKTDAGKPYFKNFPELYFSLSHTKGKVMAVLSDRPCGCDIEGLRPMKAEIRKKILSPDEMIFEESDDEQERRFFTLWTRKESLVKACGSGFTTRPDRVNVCDTDGQLLKSVLWEGTLYTFAETGGLPGYAVSVCLKDDGQDITGNRILFPFL